MKEKATSKNGVPIRLPVERWITLIKKRSDMVDYREELFLAISDPEAVFKGRKGESIAIRKIDSEKHLVVVYKEISPDDGFVITAWRTSKAGQIKKKPMIWP